MDPGPKVESWGDLSATSVRPERGGAREPLVDMSRDVDSAKTRVSVWDMARVLVEVVWRMGHWHVLCGAGDLGSIYDRTV